MIQGKDYVEAHRENCQDRIEGRYPRLSTHTVTGSRE